MIFEIPKFLDHLPTFSGFPVPFIVFYHEGKPDFRINDQAKQVQCYQGKLCSICGKKLFDFWWIGGTQSMESGMFTDGPMHKPCAEFSTKACPYLAGIRRGHSDRALPNLADGTKIAIITEIPMNRPDKMAMRRSGEDYVLGQMADSGNLIYKVKKWKGSPVWF